MKSWGSWDSSCWVRVRTSELSVDGVTTRRMSPPTISSAPSRPLRVTLARKTRSRSRETAIGSGEAHDAEQPDDEAVDRERQESAGLEEPHQEPDGHEGGEPGEDG